MSAPGPFGERDPDRRLRFPEQPVGSAAAPARRSAIAVASHAGSAGAEMPSSPGSRRVARGARPGTPSAATKRVAVDRLAQQPAHLRLVEGPPAAVGTSPNSPDAGSNRSAPRGSLTRWRRAGRRRCRRAPGRSSPAAKARTAWRAAAPRSSTSSRGCSSSGADDLADQP